MSTWCSGALAAAGLAFTCAPALAAAAAPLAGRWSFRSDNAALGCSISGDATLAAGSEANTYIVRMVAHETCGPDDHGVAAEICQAQLTGTHLSVHCGVLRTIPARTYYPDNFELDLRPDGAMSGVLTANWNTPALWRRGGDGAPVA